ncbi:MAG: MraY family glycosyltransferase [Patescibacteria group bacterium]
MLDYSKIIFVFCLAFVLALVLTKLVMIFASKYQIVDRPELAARKIHTQALPLAGGIAIYLSWLLVVIFLWLNNSLIDTRVNTDLLVWFLLGGLLLVLAGLADDKWHLPAKWSIWGPILAIMVLMLAGLKVSYITNPGGGVLYLDHWWGGFFSIILTFVWLLGMTYTTKLLDGLDGLATSIGLVASIVIFLVSLSWDVVGSTTSWLAISLAGVLAGFLFWNWQPAKIFLGEGGSTLIGFTLGVLAIISGSKIATALLVMGLPVLDILIVIIRRLIKHKPWWQGDQEHLHFRLLSAGLKQYQAVLLLSFISLAFGLVSLFVTTRAKLSALVLLIIIMLAISLWLNYKLKNKNYV